MDNETREDTVQRHEATDIHALFTGDRGYANPTYDTDERTCWNGHVITPENEQDPTCRECDDEERMYNR